jgi:ribosomal protein L9
MTTKDIQVQGDVLSLPAGTPIFGSVTQTDVMQAIKEAIAHNQVAANIKFDERGVKMEQSTDGKLKHLGLYDISVPLLMQSSPLLSMKVDVRPSLGKERPQIE